MILLSFLVVCGKEQWYAQREMGYKADLHFDLEEKGGRILQSLLVTTDIDERRARILVQTDYFKDGGLFEISGNDWRQKRHIAMGIQGDYAVKIATTDGMPEEPEEELEAYYDSAPNVTLPPFGDDREPVVVSLAGLRRKAPFRVPRKSGPPVVWTREECPEETKGVPLYKDYFVSGDRFVGKDGIFGWVSGILDQYGLHDFGDFPTFEKATENVKGE